jgi:hypothetical protein
MKGLEVRDVYTQYDADEAAAMAAQERLQSSTNFFTRALAKGTLAYRRARLAQTAEELEAEQLDERLADAILN